MNKELEICLYYLLSREQEITQKGITVTVCEPPVEMTHEMLINNLKSLESYGYIKISNFSNEVKLKPGYVLKIVLLEKALEYEDKKLGKIFDGISSVINTLKP